MTKKGIVVALAMMAALLPTMPTVVTASEMSETEVQEVTDELRKDSTDKVYNHFTYRIDTEKKYGLSFGNVITITGMDNVNDSTDIELVIPTEIEGYKVTKIDTDAFSGCANIKSVVLNDGLVEIGDNAFQGTSISELDIPATVTRIGMYAFAGTPVTSLVIEEGSAGIQLGVYAFRYCKN